MNNKKPTLYIIQGFIASGKSTFSRKLVQETGAIHLNPDSCVGEFFTEEETVNWNYCFEKTVDILWQKAEKYLKNNQDVIFDMGFWYKKDRDFARQVASKCNANFIHYYLYVPDNILKDRIVSSRPPKWAELHLKNFDKNKKLFENPTEDENVVTISNF